MRARILTGTNLCGHVPQGQVGSHHRNDAHRDDGSFCSTCCSESRKRGRLLLCLTHMSSASPVRIRITHTALATGRKIPGRTSPFGPIGILGCSRRLQANLLRWYFAFNDAGNGSNISCCVWEGNCGGHEPHHEYRLVTLCRSLCAWREAGAARAFEGGA